MLGMTHPRERMGGAWAKVNFCFHIPRTFKALFLHNASVLFMCFTFLRLSYYIQTSVCFFAHSFGRQSYWLLTDCYFYL